MANTIGWGKGTQNNTNGWGKYQNTIDAGSVYADSYSGETVLIGASAAFSYSKSSFHQDESDPTPTITGTTGGTFSATPSGLSINTSTGTIDLDNSTIQSYTITYTVSGVSSSQSLSVTASPFIANNFSMDFDGATSYVDAGQTNFISSTNPFTISFWFNADSLSNGSLIYLKNDLSRAFFIQVLSTGNVNFRSRYDSIWISGKTSSSTISTGSWINYVLVYNGSGPTTLGNFTAFLNGSPSTLEAGTTSAHQYTNIGNFIGRAAISGVGSNYFDGKIDEVAIWNAALSSDAVTEIYNATANNTGKVLDLNTDTGNYTSSANLQYWNRLGD